MTFSWSVGILAVLSTVWQWRRAGGGVDPALGRLGRDERLRATALALQARSGSRAFLDVLDGISDRAAAAATLAEAMIDVDEQQRAARERLRASLMWVRTAARVSLFAGTGAAVLVIASGRGNIMPLVPLLVAAVIPGITVPTLLTYAARGLRDRGRRALAVWDVAAEELSRRLAAAEAGAAPLHKP